MMQDKGSRQQKIVEIIRTRRVSRQGEIVEALEKAGFEATQSSVSRDLDELGVIKRKGAYAIDDKASSPSVGIGSSVLSLKRAGDSMLVIKCRPGLASAIAVQLDAAQFSEIVGTLAGDDTVFVAVDGAKAQARLTKQLLQLFESI